MIPLIRIDNMTFVYKSYERGETWRDTLLDVFKRAYKKTLVLEDITLEIQKGEMIALLGPNGAGKTTLQKLITGILTPTSGEISVGGQVPFHRQNEFLKRIGVLFGQKGQLITRLPVADSLELNKSIYQIDNRIYRERVEKLTELLQISTFINKPVRNLSLGQRMRAELVLTLLHDPEIILLDEPTNGLDIVSQRIVRDFIRYLHEVEGKTIILTSHNIADIKELIGRLVILMNGRVHFDGPLSELLSIHRTDFFKLEVCIGENQKSDTLSSDQIKNRLVDLADVKFDRLSLEKNPLEEVLYKLFSRGGQP